MKKIGLLTVITLASITCANAGKIEFFNFDLPEKFNRAIGGVMKEVSPEEKSSLIPRVNVNLPRKGASVVVNNVPPGTYNKIVLAAPIDPCRDLDIKVTETSYHHVTLKSDHKNSPTLLATVEEKES
jgi:hypothetical protein